MKQKQDFKGIGLRKERKEREGKKKNEHDKEGWVGCTCMFGIINAGKFTKLDQLELLKLHDFTILKSRTFRTQGHGRTTYL